jgi:hypothetical protein
LAADAKPGHLQVFGGFYVGTGSGARKFRPQTAAAGRAPAGRGRTSLRDAYRAFFDVCGLWRVGVMEGGCRGDAAKAMAGQTIWCYLAGIGP